ncbi:MAG: hypothetical protein ABI112_09490 [Terracoccus sp.]
MTQPLDLQVAVESAPEPGLLRPAIAAALAGRPWPEGPEAQVAAVVAAAVRGRQGGVPMSESSVGGGEGR